jgi:hypothetical protein
LKRSADLYVSGLIIVIPSGKASSWLAHKKQILPEEK